MRIAVVADRRPEKTAARLSVARARGEAVLIAPPELVQALWPEAQGVWAASELCSRVSIGIDEFVSARAFEALRAAGPFDEVRFLAAGGLGQVACAEARTGGVRVAANLVIELEPEDAALPKPLLLGAGVADRLVQESVRLALRDADAVEGDSSARAALLAAGWELARPGPRPAWGAAEAPGVSAVVTFHNLGRWLPECLASLAAQTVPIEIIVVDDGSEPAERALLDAEAARYPSVRVVRQEQRGPSAARNRGVAEAAHDLILMVDADNVMRPRLVERLREALRNRPDAAFACPAFRSFKDQGGATLLHYGPAEGCDDALLVRNVRGDTCALHTRAGLEKLGGFDARSPDCEDWRLWIHAADDGLSGVAVPEVLFDYRERADSRLRSTPAIETAHARLELLREHPRLLGRHASSVSLLAASALLAEAQHHRNLGRDDREGELQALTGAGATAHLEIERLGAELSRRKEQVALLEQRLVEAGQQLVAVDAKRSAAVAAREQGQLKIAELEESGVITTAALHEAEQAAAQAQAAAGEMAKSSAVAASRLLHRASPSLHGVVGRASRLVVRMLRRRG